jgi:hypothetical protein
MELEARRRVDIPVRQLIDIYERLSSVFGDSATIIGGRAVNLLCFHSKRNTNDIDVVIDPSVFTKNLLRQPSAYNDIRERLLDSGFIVDSSKGPLSNVVDKESGICVDVYFSRDVSGIPINDIIKGSLEMNLHAGSKAAKVRVASPFHMIMMKYNVFLSDGNGRGSREGKDGDDIKNIIQNHYGSIKDFLDKERVRLYEMLPEKEDMTTFIQTLLAASFSNLRREGAQAPK